MNKTKQSLSDIFPILTGHKGSALPEKREYPIRMSVKLANHYHECESLLREIRGVLEEKQPHVSAQELSIINNISRVMNVAL